MIAPYSDAPGSARTDDQLGRGSFVDAVVDLLSAVSNSNDSTVISLEGTWGSGKTQILNEIRPLLRQQNIRVVNFTPWAAEDTAGLQAEFHAALRESFAGLSKVSPVKLKSTGTKLAAKSVPLLGAIPFVGESIRDTASGLIAEDSWERSFEEYAAEIKKASVSILVIVDDLDRLLPNELLHVLKTVRLLGRLPRVNYLLAFDHSALISTLAVGLGGSHEDASSFLEKIVQYPLAVPPAQDTHLRRILTAGLSGLLNSTPANVAAQAESRFWHFYDGFMRNSLLTVRGVKRYAAQAQVYMKLVHREVDAADFLALTFIRLEHPRVYERLRFWKQELLRKFEGGTSQKTTNWDDLLIDIGYDKKDQRELVIKMLSSIFPAMTPYASSVNLNQAKASNPDYFDRYFVFSVPASDVSDAWVERDLEKLIRSLYPKSEHFSNTFDHPDADVARLAIKKAISRSEAVEPGQEHERIVEYVLTSMGKRVHEELEGRYNPRLFAQADWLNSSTKRYKTERSVEDWKSLTANSDLLSVAKVARDVIDEFQGDSIPVDLHAPVPAHIESLRAATSEVLRGQLLHLIFSDSYDGKSRQFLEVNGSLGWLQDDAGTEEVRAGISNSGVSLPHVAGWFVQPGRSEANHFFFDESGSDLSSLDIDGLYLLVGPETLAHSDIDVKPLGSASEQTRARERRAVEDIKKWREALPH